MTTAIKTNDSALRTGWKAKMLARVTASDERTMREALHGDKVRLLSELRGTILEIGPGTGPNLPYYRDDAHIIGLEPNAYVQPELREKADRFAGTFELKVGSAEAIDLPDGSVDAVVSTMVLCSVDDVAAVLAEVRRVLVPGGRFVFIEHVLAPGSVALRALQYAAAPFWHTCGDGCCPVRRTWQDIEAAGFCDVAYEHRRYPFPIPVSATCIVGTATR